MAYKKKKKKTRSTAAKIQVYNDGGYRSISLKGCFLEGTNRTIDVVSSSPFPFFFSSPRYDIFPLYAKGKLIATEKTYHVMGEYRYRP
jgi:hypothetical protein